MNSQELYSFGVNAETGDYAFPMTWAEATELARQGKFEPQARPLGVKAGVDPADLSSAGWGVVFPKGTDQSVRDALHELLCHRRATAASKNQRLYRELTYEPGESKLEFLTRHALGPGPVDPDSLPSYLLLVGDPEEIPFSFQYQLGVQFAVGRLYFDSVADYGNYASSVIQTETTVAAPRPKKAAFFGVHNQNDEITGLCVEHMVKPLSENLTRSWPSWRCESHLGKAASKERLAHLLGGEETPALLFTAGHGMCFSKKRSMMRERQGALVCYDWPGPGSPGRDEHYFAARDVADKAQLLGVICFHLACFSAGTPSVEGFGHGESHPPRRQAESSFVAKLPQRLLGHDKGGALAVIGHVDTTWEESFHWQGVGGQPAVYESALHDIMAGLPVGMAIEHFSSRYAELSTMLCELHNNQREYGQQPDDQLLVRLWTAHNDARGFIVLGDPAVRLRTEDCS